MWRYKIILFKYNENVHFRDALIQQINATYPKRFKHTAREQMYRL